MEDALKVLGALLALLTLYLSNRAVNNRTARIQAEALRVAETARRESLEKAADAERRARAVEIDAEIAEVRSVDAALRLRERLSRARTDGTL